MNGVHSGGYWLFRNVDYGAFVGSLGASALQATCGALGRPFTIRVLVQRPWEALARTGRCHPGERVLSARMAFSVSGDAPETFPKASIETEGLAGRSTGRGPCSADSMLRLALPGRFGTAGIHPSTSGTHPPHRGRVEGIEPGGSHSRQVRPTLNRSPGCNSLWSLSSGCSRG